MPVDAIFVAIHVVIAPAWVALIFAPRWRGTQLIAHSVAVPLLLGAVYGALLTAAIGFGQAAEGAGMSSLAAISALFSHPVGVLTGWTHYLVFDLFVGAWIARDAQRRSVPHALVVPALILTLMFGPLGLLLYLVGRSALRRGGWSLNEA
ncbi:MAG: ABA4-like family protein [Hyphomonadaceae bacterium]